MKYKFVDKHEAQACVLLCMDFRFKDATFEYLKNEMKLDGLDVIAMAGASKNIADPKELTDYQFTLRQIYLSERLHDIDKIVIVDHSECGAYGSSEFFGGKEKEKKAHAKNLLKSEKLLKKRYPDIEIILLYANLEENEIWFEKIN